MEMMGKNLTRCLSFFLSTHPMCLAGSYTEDVQSPSTGGSKATIAVRRWGGNWVRGGEGGRCLGGTVAVAAPLFSGQETLVKVWRSLWCLYESHLGPSLSGPAECETLRQGGETDLSNGRLQRSCFKMLENHYPRLRCHASRDRAPLTSSFHAPACLGLCPTFATTSRESLAGHFTSLPQLLRL